MLNLVEDKGGSGGSVGDESGMDESFSYACCAVPICDVAVSCVDDSSLCAPALQVIDCSLYVAQTATKTDATGRHPLVLAETLLFAVCCPPPW